MKSSSEGKLLFKKFDGWHCWDVKFGVGGVNWEFDFCWDCPFVFGIFDGGSFGGKFWGGLLVGSFGVNLLFCDFAKWF